MPIRRSAVWNYFSKISGDGDGFTSVAKCGHCEQQYVMKDGSTHSLWRHLRSRHLDILGPEEKQEEKLSRKRATEGGAQVKRKRTNNADLNMLVVLRDRLVLAGMVNAEAFVLPEFQDFLRLAIAIGDRSIDILMTSESPEFQMQLMMQRQMQQYQQYQQQFLDEMQPMINVPVPQ